MWVEDDRQGIRNNTLTHEFVHITGYRSVNICIYIIIHMGILTPLSDFPFR